MSKKKSGHKWAFFRAGGVDQVALRDGSDVANLDLLDKKLWVALACPISGTELDEKTLAMVDTDNDSRIRPPEVLEAVAWSAKIFKSLDLLFEKGNDLPLAQLNDETPEGKAVLASATRILEDQGKQKDKSISLDDVAAMEKVLSATKFNGDGIVPPDSAEDGPLLRTVQDILDAVGSVQDRSGKAGIDKALAEKFYEEATAYAAWLDEGNADGVHTLSDATEGAASALAAVEDKVGDFYARGKLAAFDTRGEVMLNASDAELTALGPKLLVQVDDEVKKLPLARVDANLLLPLGAGVNPAWADAIAAFAKDAVVPILGPRTSLTQPDFESIRGKLAAFRAWNAKKPATGVAKLSAQRVREILEPDMKASVFDLIAQDVALADDYAEIAHVEKAIRYRRDLLRLLRNFVNFADFYNKKDATFQAGSLFLDGRECELVIFVNDSGKHAALGGLSKAYLAYCDITRIGADKKQIVAALTAGDVDNVMVRRNGVFYDRKGQDWDATITSIIENPISVRQAFWSPYKRLVRLLEEYVAKRAADKEKESAGIVDNAAASATKATETPPAPAVAPVAAAAAPAAAGAAKKPMDIGTVAAIGVAIGGIGTFIGMIVSKFIDLGFWMPFGIIAVLLVVSGPSMLIAWLKLRQRNLGPLLDANGWAVNAMTKINVPFGGSLTRVRELPKGASRTHDDPYAEKATPWGLYITGVVVLALVVFWAMGKLDRWLPETVQSSKVLAPAAPAATPSAAPSAPPAPASAAPAAPAK